MNKKLVIHTDKLPNLNKYSVFVDSNDNITVSASELPSIDEELLELQSSIKKCSCTTDTKKSYNKLLTKYKGNL